MELSWLRMNTERMNTDHEAMEQLLATTRQDVEAIKARMDLLNGMWTGPAHDAEMQQFEADYENIQELCRLFQELIDRFQEDCSAYTQCEQQVQDLVNAL